MININKANTKIADQLWSQARRQALYQGRDVSYFMFDSKSDAEKARELHYYYYPTQGWPEICLSRNRYFLSLPSGRLIDRGIA